MNKAQATAILRVCEADLRDMGIERLSLFGSTARGEERADSDIDLAATLRPDVSIGAFRLVRIERSLADLLGTKVDLITEPSGAARLQRKIDRDRVHVF